MRLHLHHPLLQRPAAANGVANEKHDRASTTSMSPTGFTLVDQGGSAAVYRIDLCWPSVVAVSAASEVAPGRRPGGTE